MKQPKISITPYPPRIWQARSGRRTHCSGWDQQPTRPQQTRKHSTAKHHKSAASPIWTLSSTFVSTILVLWPLPRKVLPSPVLVKLAFFGSRLLPHPRLPPPGRLTNNSPAPLRQRREYTSISAAVEPNLPNSMPPPALRPATKASAWRGAAPKIARASAATTSAVILSRRDLTVNDAQKVTLGIIAAYVVGIALLWNLPYIKWVLWPFKVLLPPSRSQSLPLPFPPLPSQRQRYTHLLVRSVFILNI